MCNIEIDDAGSADEDVVVKGGVEDGGFVLVCCEEVDGQIEAEVTDVIQML